jgi:hypothetical protein
MHGIKGTDYELADGRIKVNKDELLYSGWEASRAFENKKHFRAYTTDQKGFEKIYRDVLTKNVIPNPICGYDYDGSWEGPGQFDERSRLINEMDVGLRNGTYDKSVDEYVKEQLAAGSNDLAAEIQKQVDEWIEKK